MDSSTVLAEIQAMAANIAHANDPVLDSKFQLQYGCRAQKFAAMTAEQQQDILDNFEPVVLTLGEFSERRLFVTDLSTITTDPDDAGKTAYVYPGDCVIERFVDGEKGMQLSLIIGNLEWLRADDGDGRKELEKILFEQYYLSEIVYPKDIETKLKIVQAESQEYRGRDFQEMVASFADDSSCAYHSIAKHYAQRHLENVVRLQGGHVSALSKTMNQSLEPSM